MPNFWLKKEPQWIKQRQFLFLSFSFSFSLRIKSIFRFVSIFLEVILCFLKMIILFEQGGKSPLWICCERGDIEMANLLIDNKAKVDLSTNVNIFSSVFWMFSQKKTYLYQSSFFGGRGNRKEELLFVVLVKEGILKWHNYWSTKVQISTFLHEMLFFSSTPLFSLSHFSKFSQLISETKEISFNSPLFGRVGVLYVLQFWRMISKWFISFLKRVLIQIFFQKYVFYFLNVLSLYLCWRGEKGKLMNFILSFCHFRIKCLHGMLLVKKGV